MTTDNFCFYLQNRQIQTSQAGQQDSDTSPFSIPWLSMLSNEGKKGFYKKNFNRSATGSSPTQSKEGSQETRTVHQQRQRRWSILTSREIEFIVMSS